MAKCERDQAISIRAKTSRLKPRGFGRKPCLEARKKRKEAAMLFSMMKCKIEYENVSGDVRYHMGRGRDVS